MGRTTFTVKELLSPLSGISERYNILPSGRTLVVKSRKPRAIFFLDGGLELTAGERPAIRINAGDALLVRTSDSLLYRSRLPGRDARVHALILTFRDSPPTTQEKAPAIEARFADALAEALNGVRHFPANRWGNKLLMLRDALAEMEKGGLKAAWKISGICISILADFLEDVPLVKMPGAKPDTSARGMAAVDHVRLFMQEHIREPLNLADLAWQVRLSQEYLARLFRRFTGETVFECLDRMRVNESKRLLVVSDLALGEIAEQCGYSSVNLLCRHFKRHVGTTPLAHRAKNQTAEDSSPSKFSR